MLLSLLRGALLLHLAFPICRAATTTDDPKTVAPTHASSESESESESTDSTKTLKDFASDVLGKIDFKEIQENLKEMTESVLKALNIDELTERLEILGDIKTKTDGQSESTETKAELDLKIAAITEEINSKKEERYKVKVKEKPILTEKSVVTEKKAPYKETKPTSSLPNNRTQPMPAPISYTPPIPTPEWTPTVLPSQTPIPVANLISNSPGAPPVSYNPVPAFNQTETSVFKLPSDNRTDSPTTPISRYPALKEREYAADNYRDFNPVVDQLIPNALVVPTQPREVAVTIPSQDFISPGFLNLIQSRWNPVIEPEENSGASVFAPTEDSWENLVSELDREETESNREQAQIAVLVEEEEKPTKENISDLSAFFEESQD